ncbi:MAG: type IV pilin protein [Betaproteobacteria bacterium]
MQTPPYLRRRGGFTLIELMVVVAIVGILARIAFASYTSSVAKSRRNAAQGCLMEQAQYLERVYTTNLSYASAALPAASAQQCQADLSTQYTFSLPAASLTASAFAVKASAIGGQATTDASCATMTVNQTGARAPTSNCW